MKIARLSLMFMVSLSLALACQANSVSEADVRDPVVAGKFYSGDAAKLKVAVEKFLQDAVPPRVKNPVAIIVPHAGYIFSGQICADAFKQAAGGTYDIVVILGTNHTSASNRKVSLYPGSGFRTPLGVAPVDRETVAALIKADPEDCVRDKTLHESEHSVEVMIPFVQVVFPKAKIVPAVVGSPDPDICARFGRTLAKVLAGKRALIVASSDLSHYPDAEGADTVDRETLAAAASLDPARFHETVRSAPVKTITNLQTRACGEAPILAAMTTARSLGAVRGVVISYAHSGGVSIGDRSRVVGYGAVAFTAEPEGNQTAAASTPAPTAAVPLTASDKRALLAFSRETLSRLFLTDTVPLARAERASLQQTRGVFVTLKKHGELRGCIGRIAGDGPLERLVGMMTVQSAFNDSRFQPLSPSEFNEIDIEISVLTPLKDVASAADIVVGRDGVLLNKGGRSAVFLPQVATEQGWKREEMLDHLCMKAGLPAGSWKDGARLQVFQADVFGEKDFR
ncbi:MAG: hypothetical protein A4E73_00105 [Syntrophaceae bacterium PtaU1.Bin231]|nr:MAG: hypothetical protein A4E73_00105 [Syntrophaceae bacterium PtaU1.Bin231]